mmetsp:Transcript_23512/g.19418  ORF Transcript_23512/g.19418 Transcript_23512/m.19418 type:complete len:81 (+) Transcript_23512:41-283(+)
MATVKDYMWGKMDDVNRCLYSLTTTELGYVQGDDLSSPLHTRLEADGQNIHEIYEGRLVSSMSIIQAAQLSLQGKVEGRR